MARHIAFFLPAIITVPFAQNARVAVNQGLVEGSIWGPRVYCLLPNGPESPAGLPMPARNAGRLGVLDHWYRQLVTSQPSIQTKPHELLAIPASKAMAALLHCDD